MKHPGLSDDRLCDTVSALVLVSFMGFWDFEGLRPFSCMYTPSGESGAGNLSVIDLKIVF